MSIFFNELHYDNDGADVGEFIELAGPAGASLDGWSLVLYNGSNGAAYQTVALNGRVFADAGAGVGFEAIFIDGIQNGAPDGIALVAPDASVVQFISYEGTLTATDGPAAGLTSTDIGVEETGTTPVGFSLQLQGTGEALEDFSFAAAPLEATPGAVNTGQTFTASSDGTFTLELLHFADQEGTSSSVVNAPNMSAVLNALRAQDLGADGEDDYTITLSSGDAFIPGVFFDASAAVFGAGGIADIQIQNELGVQAITLGNHEFDLGTQTLAQLISGLNGGSPIGNFAALSGTALDGLDFTGAAFPYLSANLDVSTDGNLAPLAVAGGLAPQPGVIASSTILTVAGPDGEELIGVVGATTPTLASISSSGGVTISPAPFGTVPTSAELDALAAVIQEEVDALLADNPGLNKIILSSHMQRIGIEQELAARLTDVDIVIAGGSNTRLFDDNDRPRDGDSDQGQYPQFITNAGGTTTALVNTDGSYKYVGRLVIDFDADGNIIADSYDATVSGAYATDAQGVTDLGAEGLVDPEIQAIADAIEAQIIATESNVFGESDVFLNGNRSGGPTDGVRTQETNLGNLTVDANLAAAQAVDDTVVVSIKNGGGIRASIGETVVLPGGTEAVRLPNGELVDSDGNVIKPEGGISQTDIQTALAFNNDLVLLTVTKAELVALLEHGVSALPGVAGSFPQIAGVKFSYDETLPAGSRVLNAGVFDADGGLIAELVRGGEIAGDATQEFRITTLGFLAEPRFDGDGNFIGGGDGYPFPNSNTDPLLGEVGPNAARINLVALEEEGVRTGDAMFADDGTEQDALAEYLDDFFNPAKGGVAYAEEDGAQGVDERIQNVAFRADTVFDGVVTNPEAPVPTEELGSIGEYAAFDTGLEAGAEVVAYEDGVLYVTNGAAGGIDVWDLASKTKLDFVDLSFLPGYNGVQSVAVKNGLIAVAVATPNLATATAFGEVIEGQNGYVALIDAVSLQVIDRVTVGNLPDMVTFNADGTKILVANEGEFNSENGLDRDPEGSVSIIDVSNLIDPRVSTIDFNAFDGLEVMARAAGIRLAEGASLLRGLEPEYITVAGNTAYVVLQEANAIAVLDIAAGVFTDIFSAGVVDHSLAGNEIDPDDNGEIDIRTVENLVGLRMPDAITSFEKDGQTYLITANEGDGRGDAPEGDEARVGDILAGEVPGLSIDASVDTTGLERLTVSTIDGDTDGDGDIDVLHSFGSRGFTIFDSAGNVIFDSGSQFAAIIAEIAPERFNDDDGEDGENRSDNKGVEPEAVTVGEVNGSLYAFIGLERDSGIMIYNIDDPANAVYVDYIPGFGAASGDHLAPETIAFIPADESPTGTAQIAVAYEVSGETVVYNLGEVLVEVVTPKISEFQPNPEGADPATTLVELTGEPGAAFDLWLIAVESDAGGSAGTVDSAENVTGTFDANGIAVVEVPDLENPSFTYILADDFTGTVGTTDLDTDNDGTPDDLSTLGEVFDAIGVPDTDGEPLYGAAAGGTDLAFATGEPALLFRDGATGEIYRVEDGLIYDAAGNEVSAEEFDVDPLQTTFGATNPIRVGAQPDLQITEIWSGQDGTDLTADWFEITNFGSVSWTPDLGALFYDDDSADPAVADAILGLSEIAAGESVIVVIGTETDVTEFETVWVADIDLSGIKVGYTDGAGLGAGGDAVTLFLDADGTLTGADAVDSEAYPDTAGASGQSWDVVNAQFSTVEGLTNVVATTATAGSNGDEPAVGSPGSLTEVKADDFTAIYTIQGSGAASALEGEEVSTRGVVTATFFGSDKLGGFFIQDATGDGDASTSDGIFVFAPSATVAVGDVLELTGIVSEFFDKTQISGLTTLAVIESGATLPEAVKVSVDGTADLEALEGMLIELVAPTGDADGNLSVTETFSLGRFGEFEIAPEVNINPTQVIDPGAANAAAIAELAAKNAAERFIVSDGRTDQNPEVKLLIDDGAETGLVDGAYDSGDAAGPTLRIGAEFESIAGVVDFAFGNYVLQYDQENSGPLTPVEGTNDRPDLPEVGGDLQVASFNVLNFFSTLDQNGNTTLGGLEPRGANNQAEFDRQLDKLVTGIAGLEAEIVTLQELENGGFGEGSAIAVLVDALNDAAGSAVWSFVDYSDAVDNDDGLIGTDAITTGIIYRNDAVTEVGKAVKVFEETSSAATFALADVLNQVASSDDQLGDFQRNRPATAATFETANGGKVTVVANHFKSKGDSNLEDVVADAQTHVDGGGTTITQADIDAVLADGNYDQGDGQGFWNAVRAEAAAELVAWLATNPTGDSTANILVTGDLNAYGLEDPVDAVVAGGYTHLVGGGSDDYGYTFFGEQGALDHAFASGGLAGVVTGAAEWHVNADEPVFLDYNLDFEDAAFFDGDDPFRSSDHDPLLVGLTLEPEDGGLAEDDAYEVTAEALASEGWSWFRIGDVNDGSRLTSNDATKSPIAEVNGEALIEGEWFDGDNGGQFRTFSGGVVDFRNLGDKVAAGDTTGFTYTVIENGVRNTASVTLTVTNETGPAQDDNFLFSEADPFANFVRIAGTFNDTRLLANDEVDGFIDVINNERLFNGEWFAGDNGGEFRVFKGGVVDFRFAGDDFESGENTGFTYGVLEDGVYDTAVVTLTVDTFDFI